MSDQVAQRLATGKLAVGQDDAALVLQGGDQGQEVVRRNLEFVEQIRRAQTIRRETDGSGREIEQGLFRDRVVGWGHGNVLLLQRRRGGAPPSRLIVQPTLLGPNPDQRSTLA
jgi:hypothetical protein